MQPRPDFPRNSPIAGVLLTNADLDHALGMLLLRQRERPLIVYANDETRAALHWIDSVLKPFCQMEWRTVGTSKLDRLNQSSSRGLIELGEGLAVEAIDLGGSVAFQLQDASSGAVPLIAPAVGEINHKLSHTFNN